MTRAVLTFHSIDNSGSVLSYPVRQFWSFIEKLLALGTPVVSFSQLLHMKHGVTLTFDDGMQSVHQHALPVLRANGIPAHLFLTTGSVGKRPGWTIGNHQFDVLSWDEIEECQLGNISVECHTVSHPDLRTLTPEQIMRECRSADDEIERRLGHRPNFMAFPFGHYNQSVIHSIAPLYKACFTTQLAYLDAAARTAEIPRLDSYYLQAGFCHTDPLGLCARAYLGLRSIARSALRRQ